MNLYDNHARFIELTIRRSPSRFSGKDCKKWCVQYSPEFARMSFASS